MFKAFVMRTLENDDQSVLEENAGLFKISYISF